MGGTQIALIVVGVVLALIAVLVAVTQVRENPVLANEMAVRADADAIVRIAKAEWYERSGASESERTFLGMSLSALRIPPANDNGAFEIQGLTEKSFQVIATGVEDGDNDGDPLQIRVTYNVFSDTTMVEKIRK